MRSEFLFRWFRRYAAWYVRRHFHSVRVSGDRRLPAGPVIVVMNHPSWWDPMIGLLLTGLFPERTPFAPMDAVALEKYRLFRRLGFFGVERGTRAGAREFLRQSRAILQRPDAMLWVTAQGEFTDARVRPIRLKPGIEHLGPVPILPLALEYAYWHESRPEVLIRFGPPCRDNITGALQKTADHLAADSVARNEAAFETILGGTAGVGGMYDWWRRLAARWRGESFTPEHGAILRKEVRS